MSGKSHLGTGATVSIVIIVMLLVALCSLWILRKTGSMCNGAGMLRRSNSIRLPKHTDNAVPTISNTHGNSPICSPIKRLDRSACTTPTPYTISVDSQQTQNLPCHANMADTRVLVSHAQPLFCPMDNVEATGSDTCDDRLNVTQQPSSVVPSSSEGTEARMLLARTQAVIPNVVPQEKQGTMTMEPLGKRVARSLNLQVMTDTPNAYYPGPAKTPVFEVEVSDSGTPVIEDNSDWSDPLPVSSVHPPRYCPSSVAACESALEIPKHSISLELCQIAKTGATAAANIQVPSPPPTPRTCPMHSPAKFGPQFNLHRVSLEMSSNKLTEDIKTWSDVLSFAEYEREAYLVHARKVFSFRHHLPSPPPTPTLRLTTPSPSANSARIVLQEGEWLSAKGTPHVALEGICKDSDKDLQETAYRPQAGRDECPLVHMSEKPRISRGRRPPIDIDDENDSGLHDGLPPYQDFGFDYETRLLLKRATSLLVKPVRPVVSTTRVVSGLVAPIVRPRPPLVEYEPLLLRRVDRSKIKTREQFLGLDVPPLGAISLKSTIPTIPPKITRSGTKGEVSPHVQVLELLIEELCVRRTGDIALGMV